MLPNLGGLTKAMYSVGRFLSVEDDAAVLGFENDIHRRRCEEKRPDVEAALGRHFGRPVPLRLVVDDGHASVPNTTPAEPDDDPHPAEVHGLADAPADDRTSLDRMFEAFPGAELLPDEGKAT